MRRRAASPRETSEDRYQIRGVCGTISRIHQFRAYPKLERGAHVPRRRAITIIIARSGSLRYHSERASAVGRCDGSDRWPIQKRTPFRWNTMYTLRTTAEEYFVGVWFLCEYKSSRVHSEESKFDERSAVGVDAERVESFIPPSAD